jgi:hypothetical protein
MVQGFFLDRVCGEGAYIAVKGEDQGAAFVFAYFAAAPSTLRENAAVGTEEASELSAFKAFVKPALIEGPFSVRQRIPRIRREPGLSPNDPPRLLMYPCVP